MNIRYNEGQKSIATRRKQLKQLAMGIVGKQMKNAVFPHLSTQSPTNQIF